MTTTHRTTATAAAIVSLVAASAPAAGARLADLAPADRQAPAVVYSRPDKSMVYSGPDEPMLPTSATAGGDFLAPAAPPAVVQVQAPQNGFDWGDAGIGAAGGVALALLGVGGALAISQHRPQRTRRTTA